MNQFVSPKGIDQSKLSKLFADVPKPDRAEWAKALAAMKPWMSPEKFAETEKIHWRMFERANRWFEPSAHSEPKKTGS
jgi:hypothetical protein